VLHEGCGVICYICGVTNPLFRGNEKKREERKREGMKRKLGLAFVVAKK
jgi:hypothetical protein